MKGKKLAQPIDWSAITHFSPKEFSEDPDRYAEPLLIETLNAYREFLGHIVHPSPAERALARFTGSKTSRHYAVGRLSDAVDVFCECNIREAWLAAMRSKMWGGVGVYFDTKYEEKPWPMLHLDLRPGPTITWFRIGGEYFYPDNNIGARQRLFGMLNAA